MTTYQSVPQIKRSVYLHGTAKFRGLLVGYYTTVFTFTYGLKAL